MQTETSEDVLQDIRLFSTGAISLATFLGGPLGGAILAGINYKRMGRFKSGNRAILLGVAASLILCVVIMLIPESIMQHIPNILIPAIYTPIVVYLVDRFQGKEVKAVINSIGKKASHLVAAGWGLLSMVFFLIIGAVIVFLVPANLFEGELAEYGANKIYYDEAIPVWQVEGFHSIMLESGFITLDDGIEIQVSLENQATIIVFPVSREYWDDKLLLEDFGTLREMLEVNGIFRNPEIVLLDMDLMGEYRKELE